MARLDGLWRENKEAWETYHLLCGRAVRDCNLERLLIDRFTEGWDVDRVVGLVERLNLILTVLEPHGRSQN